MTELYRVDEVEIIEDLAGAARIINAALAGRFILGVKGDGEDILTFVGVRTEDGGLTAVTIDADPEVWRSDR